MKTDSIFVLEEDLYDNSLVSWLNEGDLLPDVSRSYRLIGFTVSDIDEWYEKNSWLNNVGAQIVTFDKKQFWVCPVYKPKYGNWSIGIAFMKLGYYPPISLFLEKDKGYRSIETFRKVFYDIALEGLEESKKIIDGRIKSWIIDDIMEDK